MQTTFFIGEDLITVDGTPPPVGTDFFIKSHSTRHPKIREGVYVVEKVTFGLYLPSTYYYAEVILTKK